MKRQTLMPGRHLRAMILVDQPDRFQPRAGRRTDRIDQVSIRNRDPNHDGKVSRDGRLAQELMVNRRRAKGVFERLQIKLERENAERYPLELDDLGIDLADKTDRLLVLPAMISAAVPATKGGRSTG